MNFGINDMLQALNGLTTSMAGVKSTFGSRQIDHSYITPTIIAVGDFTDEKADDALSIAQGDPVLMWNLSAVRLIFNNQIIDTNWRTVCQYTRAPLMGTIFSLCLSIKSWYDLYERNLSLIHCPPGRPNLGIVIACFLKYIGAFEHAAHAYDFYCSKRLRSETVHSLASSYRNLFTNVDKAVDCNGYQNSEPLHLKTITITGLPVEELPSIEVWDLNGLVFESHSGWRVSSACTWNPEYGDAFFKIAQSIIGDFSIICSFGGQLACKKDKSTLILKYQNTTAFLVDQVLELKHHDVDINPDYADSIDVEIFSMHLVFDTHNEYPASQPQAKELAAQNADWIERLSPLPLPGLAAFEAGLDEISKSHPVVPDSRQFSELIEAGYEDRYVPVALQLGNNDSRAAIHFLKLMKSRITELVSPPSNHYVAEVSPSTSATALEVSSEDSNWEVIDLRCPVCLDDSSAKSDQVISCANCNRIFHTFCVGLRRIPFGNATETDRASRERYIRCHFNDWQCSACQRPSAQEVSASGAPAAVFAELPPTTRSATESPVVVVSGGDVIVTDQLHPLVPQPLGAATPIRTSNSSRGTGSSPVVSVKSKQDHVAALVALLSSADIALEDLIQLSEEEQRQKIIAVLSARYPDLSPDKLQPIAQTQGSLDLATAMKGILMELRKQGVGGIPVSADVGQSSSLPATQTQVLGAVSPPARYFGKSLISEAAVVRKESASALNKEVEKQKEGDGKSAEFNARTQMLEIIKRKANIAAAASAGAAPDQREQRDDAPLGVPVETAAQLAKGQASTAVKDLPQFAKYFKMIKAGISKQAVAQKLISDRVATSPEMAEYLMTINPDEVLPEDYYRRFNIQVQVANHPKFEKFFKMLNIGIGKDAIQSKMSLEGLDPRVLELSPEQWISFAEGINLGPPANSAAGNAGSGSTAGPIGENPKYAKFFKMLKVGLPIDVVKTKMMQEGLNPALIDRDPKEVVQDADPPPPPPVADAAKPAEEMVAVSEHPKYAKYFKMLKMGLPRPAVLLKMQQEGVDASILDKDPSDKVPLQDPAPGADEGAKVPAGEHPAYAKYFKMLKVGLPLDAVKAKVTQDGLDPTVMDKSPTDLIPVKTGPAANAGPIKAQQLKVRKKKLYWKALDASKVQGNSLWADGNENDLDLQFDEEEFNQLFVESLSSKSTKAVVQKSKEPKKQKVVLIDRKRAQNAGIALARIRYSPEDLKEKILNMDDEGLHTDQLKSLIEFLPAPEEVDVLRGYSGDLELLGQAERYMLVMMDPACRSAAKRLRCMIYKQQFKPRYMECRAKIAKVQNACDDVKMSTRLRKVLKAILKVGNQLNDGEEHKGFTVDSLLKLQSAKAFDKKTSVLQYVITVIHRNDEDCLLFPEDLKHVSEAARMSMDVIVSEKAGLVDEFNTNLRMLEDVRNSEGANNTDSMLDFLVKADGLCKDLERGIDKAKEKFTKVLEYFGEDPAMASQEFFSTLYKFIQEFVTVRDHVQRTIRQQQAALQKQQQQEKEGGGVKQSNAKLRRFSTMTPMEAESLAQLSAAASGPAAENETTVGKEAASAVAPPELDRSKLLQSITTHNADPASRATMDDPPPRKPLTRRKSSYM